MKRLIHLRESVNRSNQTPETESFGSVRPGSVPYRTLYAAGLIFHLFSKEIDQQCHKCVGGHGKFAGGYIVLKDFDSNCASCAYQDANKCSFFNVIDQKGIGVQVYHIQDEDRCLQFDAKGNIVNATYLTLTKIQPICYLSRTTRLAENCY